MPYIKQEDREYLDNVIDLLYYRMKKVDNIKTKEAGVFNYVVSRLTWKLIGNPRYEKINRYVGALECAKMELYRRIAAPYEDLKIKENGDVEF